MTSFVVRHRLIWLLLIGTVCVLADQATKVWAQTTLARKVVQADGEAVYFPKAPIVVLADAIQLVYVENPAAAFSLTASLPDWFRTPFLLIVGVIACLFFLVWYFRMKDADALILTAFSLILGGAVGNIIDRFRLHYVIDFLDVYAGFLGYPQWHWPTFNIADSCIVVGAALVFIHAFKVPASSPSTKKAA